MFNLNNQKLLIIAPHADDEVLGCGGLMHRIKKSGGKVYVLFLTLGTTSDYSQKGISTGSMRRKEIETVMKYLDVDGFDIAFAGNEFHLKLDRLPSLEIIEMIEKKSKVAIQKVRPTILASTQVSDYNQDHRASAQACLTATRPAPHDLKHFIPNVLGYEFAANSWNVTSPNIPNLYISLDKEDLAVKIKAMQLYKSQVREGAHTRAFNTIEYLAKLRGAQSGVYAAEAYFSFRMFI